MTAPIALDTAFCRTFFPCLSDDWVFFENAGGTLVPVQVIDRVLRLHDPLPGSTRARRFRPRPMPPTAWRRAGKRWRHWSTRHRKRSSSAPTPRPMSTPWRMRYPALVHADGDEIVVTNQDHEANSGAWRRWAETGIVVREWRIDPNSGELSVDDLDVLLTERTRLVCFPWCSNIVGTSQRRRVRSSARSMPRVRWPALTGSPLHRTGGSMSRRSMPISSCAAPTRCSAPTLGCSTARRELLERAVNQMHYFCAGQHDADAQPWWPQPRVDRRSRRGSSDYIDAVDAHHFGASTALILRLG